MAQLSGGAACLNGSNPARDSSPGKKMEQIYPSAAVGDYHPSSSLLSLFKRILVISEAPQVILRKDVQYYLRSLLKAQGRYLPIYMHGVCMASV